MENAASTALLLVLNQWCHVPNAERKQPFRGGEQADEVTDSIRLRFAECDCFRWGRTEIE